jgi:hypothetical protein
MATDFMLPLNLYQFGGWAPGGRRGAAENLLSRPGSRSGNEGRVGAV